MHQRITHTLTITLIAVFSTVAAAVPISAVKGAWKNDIALSEDKNMSRILITIPEEEPGKVGVDLLRYDLSTVLSGKIDDQEFPVALYKVSPAEFITCTLDLTINAKLHMNIVTEHRFINKTTIKDYYFTLMNKPDLVVGLKSIPYNNLGHEKQYWTSFTVLNYGAAITKAMVPNVSNLRAAIVNKTRDGESVTHSGYFSLSDIATLGTGEYYHHDFAIGTGMNWSPGEYSYQVKVDSLEVLNEENEGNNLSQVREVRILPEYDIMGKIYHSDELLDITDLSSYVMVRDITAGIWLSGNDLDFNFYPEINGGAYTINGIPEEHECYINAYFYQPDTNRNLPGNYITGYQERFTLSDMTYSQKRSTHIYVYKTMHMTSPSDNSVSFGMTTDPLPVHQHGVLFEWDNDCEYYDNIILSIKKYRDSDHPDGAGYIETVVNESLTEPYYVALLDNTDEHEFYMLNCNAYDSSGKKSGMHTSVFDNGFGAVYNFKVESQSYDDLRRPKLEVLDKEYDVINDKYNVTFSLANHRQFPDELFSNAPDLPACGLNTNSSRSWVYFKDVDNSQNRSYCNISSASKLEIFSITYTGNIPESVYLLIDDRRYDNQYISLPVDVAEPCPSADLNGDCRVDLADFSKMASQWLMEME